MRFPFALTAKIARHIIKHKLARTPKFALVLQLEPLHTCNLTCTGCGRIREYSTSLKDMMSLEDCLASSQECDAPMVSICGGEPLIYPKIELLIDGLLKQGRIGQARRQRAHCDLNPSFLLFAAEVLEDLPHQIGRRDRSLVERLAAQA